MLRLVDNKIYISQGDSAVIDLRLNNYALAAGDKLVFTASTPVPIVKELDSLTLAFLGEDTADVPFGTYEYDIKLVYADGEQVALIYPTEFVVKEVV